MDDRLAAAIARLKEFRASWHDGDLSFTASKLTTEDLDVAIAVLEEAQEFVFVPALDLPTLTPPEWKPIEGVPQDRKDGRTLLLLVGGKPMRAGWMPEVGWFGDHPDDFALDGVTHWADLTSPAGAPPWPTAGK